MQTMQQRPNLHHCIDELHVVHDQQRLNLVISHMAFMTSNGPTNKLFVIHDQQRPGPPKLCQKVISHMYNDAIHDQQRPTEKLYAGSHDSD